MKKLKHLDLFSGIGGFALGLERTGGFETVAFCEIESFPKRILKKHWPKIRQYNDVKNLTKNKLKKEGIAVDIITGGFPCQDISLAGKQAGLGKETRSGLWSEIVRLVSELRPQFVLVENVAALLTGPPKQRGRWFGNILASLAKVGYNAEWQIISAADVGAPHKRERVWIIAYPARGGCKHRNNNRKIRPILSNKNWHAAKNQQKRNKRISGIDEARKIYDPNPRANPNTKRIKRLKQEDFQEQQTFQRFENVRRIEDYFNRPSIPAPLFRGGRDGIPHWVDRIKGLGNSIVPDIAELIGYCILNSKKMEQ